MINISPEAVTIWMLAGFFIGIFIGYPVAFVFAGIALFVGLATFGPSVVTLIYGRIFSLLTNYVLLAVPLFIFMGNMLECTGITERLYAALFLWLGGLRGGLALITVLIGTILAACVGIISASVSMLALVALPAMLKRGYDKSIASGAVCAGGTLGILIPPSILLVMYGPMAGISVGRLFFGAFIPGFLLSTLYIAYISVRSYIQPNIAPAIPAGERRVSFLLKMKLLSTSMLPTVIIILAVLGVIFFGIAPPTEAAAVGAFASVILAIAYRKLTLRRFYGATLDTLKMSSFVLLLGSASFAFTGVFLGAGCGNLITELVLSAPGGSWGAFAIIQFIVFILGFFIDWLGIVFIMVPIVSPIVPVLGFDPLWFALMTCINLQASFMTPPFAATIFILHGVSPPELNITMADIIRGCIPYVVLILVAMALCIAFPEIITWLPEKMIQ